jgi:hypothetical protein
MADKGNWMAGAVKRPGAFRAKAEKAGMSTQAFARKEAHNPNASPRTKKQAVLAQTFARSAKRTAKRRGRRSSAKRR